jgi:hypothetical protein
LNLILGSWVLLYSDGRANQRNTVPANSMRNVPAMASISETEAELSMKYL